MDRICQTGHESLLNSLWGPFPVRFVQHLPLFGGWGRATWAVRGSTAHPPGRQVRVLNHWAAARRSRPLSGAWPRPGPGPGQRPGPSGRSPVVSTRTCLPGGWAVEPRTAKKGQMLHETDREWSPQAVKQ